jgi:hypothetical protein
LAIDKVAELRKSLLALEKAKSQEEREPLAARLINMLVFLLVGLQAQAEVRWWTAAATKNAQGSLCGADLCAGSGNTAIPPSCCAWRTRRQGRASAGAPGAATCTATLRLGLTR